eukprot:TRINITY_DN18748_c0_g1_i1.p2 TRINITY_DN18748_c0_g1~~TRINITY_DN18748_c0_g1_i1.p2  ORF type:complete len:174 (+),score=36.75 TRINITY_DN18748_c0_g1_i1:214-735(+)
MLAARVGILFAVVFTASFGLARSTLVLFILASIEGMDAMWDSCLRVLFSQLGTDAGAGEGQVLGIVGFLQVLLGSVAPLIYQTLYAGTVHWCAPFVFFVTSGLTLAGLLLSFRLDLTPRCGLGVQAYSSFFAGTEGGKHDVMISDPDQDQLPDHKDSSLLGCDEDSSLASDPC